MSNIIIIKSNISTALGWTISAIGILQVPLWATYAIVKQKGDTLTDKIRGAFRPKANWGPTDPATFERYQKYVSNFENSQVITSNNIFARIKRNIFG